MFILLDVIGIVMMVASIISFVLAGSFLAASVSAALCVWLYKPMLTFLFDGTIFAVKLIAHKVVLWATQPKMKEYYHVDNGHRFHARQLVH